MYIYQFTYLPIYLAVDVEAENRRKVHQKEVALMNQTEKEAVQSMFECQAKYKANLEVRAAEKEAYIQDRLVPSSVDNLST